MASKITARSFKPGHVYQMKVHSDRSFRVIVCMNVERICERQIEAFCLFSKYEVRFFTEDVKELIDITTAVLAIGKEK